MILQGTYKELNMQNNMEISILVNASTPQLYSSPSVKFPKTNSADHLPKCGGGGGGRGAFIPIKGRKARMRALSSQCAFIQHAALDRIGSLTGQND